MSTHFDVIIIGGGHAGVEAALASARMGCGTLLLTQNIETLGQMSCNPAIGGIGKGHLVKEIDALGGGMGRAADAAGIQWRILNASKGPAVQATRAQADRVLYKQAIRHALENQPNLWLFQQEVVDFVVSQDTVVGVKTHLGLTFYGTSIVLTAGTFLAGKIHVGMQKSAGGRMGCQPSQVLSDALKDLPFKIGRLKTGTPPRVDGKTVDFSVMEVQPGVEPTPYFSVWSPKVTHPRQVPCHITSTTLRTQEIILENLHLSAMYAGEIEGIGPRYCPSIEDKMVRFKEKERHQIFVEPEGLLTRELYPNGLSTSLPYDIQVAFIRSIVGFEQAHITRPGYAIEYDYFNPEQLHSTLETKTIKNLFFAGQINGTTGYEEAAAQGIMAGINAALRAQGKEGFSLGREEAYIGVMIDDLITLGTTEPYRMFTSRAEYRLLLREDNADFRLSAKGYALGCVSGELYQQFEEKQQAVAAWKQGLLDAKLTQTLKRPEETLKHWENTNFWPDKPEELLWDEVVCQQVETQIKYDGYIKRQEEEILRAKATEHYRLQTDFDYIRVKGLSSEILEKLQRIRPETLGMASRIPGVTPAAISLLLVYLKKHYRGKEVV
jgi:tRNA uridine 5-carboxymethylaminomethyl modification enzyme